MADAADAVDAAVAAAVGVEGVVEVVEVAVVAVEEVAALVRHTNVVLSNCKPGWIWSPPESSLRLTAKG